jgi:hypothetical protein
MWIACLLAVMLFLCCNSLFSVCYTFVYSFVIPLSDSFVCECVLPGQHLGLSCIQLLLFSHVWHAVTESWELAAKEASLIYKKGPYTTTGVSTDFMWRTLDYVVYVLTLLMRLVEKPSMPCCFT